MTQNSIPLTMTTLQPFPFHHYNLHKILHHIASLLLPKPPYRNSDDATHTSKKTPTPKFHVTNWKIFPPHHHNSPTLFSSTTLQSEPKFSRRTQSITTAKSSNKPPISSFELMRPFELNECPLPTDTRYWQIWNMSSCKEFRAPGLVGRVYLRIHCANHLMKKRNHMQSTTPYTYFSTLWIIAADPSIAVSPRNSSKNHHTTSRLQDMFKTNREVTMDDPLTSGLFSTIMYSKYSNWTIYLFYIEFQWQDHHILLIYPCTIFA